MLRAADVGDVAIDSLFDAPLVVSKPHLPGVVQKRDLHMLQKRARQVLQDYRMNAFISIILFLTSLAMFLTSHRESGEAMENFGTVFYVISITIGFAEIGLYVFGHGFFPSSKLQTSSASNSRIQSVLSVWSPVRFRQKKVTVAGQLLQQQPFLSNFTMIFEFFLLLCSVVGYTLPGGGSDTGFGRLRYMHGLRSLRLMSPLASVIPSVTFLVNTFRASLSLLVPASSFLVFFFILFGVLSVDQFKGVMSHRCVMIDPRLQHLVNFSEVPVDTVCMGRGRPLLDDCVDAIPQTFCDPDEFVQAFTAPVVCYPPMVCRDRAAPNEGFTNFDNIFSAWLTMFHISSLSNWSEIMYGMWAGSPRIFVGGFCIMLIVVVSFIIFNFVIAIITTSYSQARVSMKLVEALSAGRRKGASMLNYRLSEFLYWGFPGQLVHYLNLQTIENGVMRLYPFHEDTRFAVLRALWIGFLVVFHALNGTHMPASYSSILRQVEVTNMVVTLIEFILSAIASGSLGKYLTDSWQQFDLFALVLTIIGTNVGLPLSIVRSLRVIQLLQMVPLVKRSHLVPNTLSASKPMLVVTCFMMVCLYVSSGVAIQLFSDVPGTDQPPENFNTPFVAVTTMFRLITMDNWEKAMYHSMREQHWTMGLIFFIPAYVMFGYMLSSLYTAVVIDAFEPNKEDKVAWQQKRHVVDEEADDGTMVQEVEMGIKHDAQNEAAVTTPVMAADGEAGAAAPDEEEEEEIEVQRIHFSAKDSSFGILGVNNKFRQLLIKLVADPSNVNRPATATEPPRMYGAEFQWVIILFVLASCVLIAVAPSRDACSLREEKALRKINAANHISWDIVFVIIFTIEMLMKMAAHGVAFPGDDRPWYLGPTYFRDVWNLLDFFLLVVMFVAFFYPQARSLRLLRALRPLRVVRRIESMRILVNGVIKSLPNIFVLFFVSVWILGVFGVVGVSLFQRKMGYCTANVIGGSTVMDKAGCTGLYFNPHGALNPAAWLRYPSHFDHLGAAMGFLVEVASLSQFDSLLRQAISITGEGKQPRPESRLHYTIFFFIFVIISAYFILNVIVGILLATLDEQRGILFLTTTQRDWHTVQREIANLRPIKRPPLTRFPSIQRLVKTSSFDAMVNVAVFFNIIIISTIHRDQAQVWSDIQFYSNIVFLVVFVVEALLKILAFGRHYFKDPWNIVDFLVVLGSIFEFTYQLITAGNRDVTITSAGRAFRILRIFRSVKRIPSLRGLFVTLGHSFPAIVSITSFLFMLLFMYANLGKDLFGQLRFQEVLTKDANFRSLELSFFTLFRMVTLDGWNKIMTDVRQYVPPICSDDETGWWYVDYGGGRREGTIEDCGVLNDCSSEATLIYFFTFYGVGSFLFLNVLIAILLDNFNYISTQARSAIRAHDLDAFQTQWHRINMSEKKSVRRKEKQRVNNLYHYEDYIDPKDLSKLIIRLFNSDNALVRCDAGVHIHPVLTAQSRLNYKKLEFELMHLAVVDNVELEKRCSFANIVLVCARMQMGREALTFRQQPDRVKFEQQQSLQIIGNTIRERIKPALERAQKRVAEAAAIRKKYSDPEQPPTDPEANLSIQQWNTDVSAAQHPSPLRRTVAQQHLHLSPASKEVALAVFDNSESPQTNNSDSHSPTQSRTQSFRKSVSFSRHNKVFGAGATVASGAHPEDAPMSVADVVVREMLRDVSREEEQARRALLTAQHQEWALLSRSIAPAALQFDEVAQRCKRQLAFIVAIEHGFRAAISIFEHSQRKHIAERLLVRRTDALAAVTRAPQGTLRTVPSPLAFHRHPPDFGFTSLSPPAQHVRPTTAAQQNPIDLQFLPTGTAERRRLHFEGQVEPTRDHHNSHRGATRSAAPLSVASLHAHRSNTLEGDVLEVVEMDDLNEPF